MYTNLLPILSIRTKVTTRLIVRFSQMANSKNKSRTLYIKGLPVRSQRRRLEARGKFPGPKLLLLFIPAPVQCLIKLQASLSMQDCSVSLPLLPAQTQLIISDLILSTTSIIIPPVPSAFLIYFFLPRFSSLFLFTMFICICMIMFENHTSSSFKCRSKKFYPFYCGVQVVKMLM